MLTILEVSNYGRDRARDEVLVEVGGPEVRWVLVEPDRGRWTEARGRELIIEHVEAPSLARASALGRRGAAVVGRRLGLRGRGGGGPGAVGDRRVLATARALRELVQLHRPRVIACGSPLLLPALVQLVGFRLSPRPALIGTLHDREQDLAARLRRGLEELGARRELARLGGRVGGSWSTFAYASLDAVFVGERALARELQERGLDRLYYTPRDPEGMAESVARELACYREVLDHVRAGRRVPPGLHERMQPEALDQRD